MEVSQELDLVKFLIAEGYHNVTYIPNLGYCGLYNFLYTVGLVVNLTEGGYDYRYCYPKDKLANCFETFVKWTLDPPPYGTDPDDKLWVKRKGDTGEYSNPNL